VLTGKQRNGWDLRISNDQGLSRILRINLAFCWLSAGPLFASGVEVGPTPNAAGIGAAAAAESESRQPCISIPPNSPINIAAPAISGIQMRSRSLFHSRRRASIVFARFSSEYSSRLLARSTCATTPPCESDSVCRAAASSFSAPVCW